MGLLTSASDWRNHVTIITVVEMAIFNACLWTVYRYLESERVMIPSYDTVAYSSNYLGPTNAITERAPTLKLLTTGNTTVGDYVDPNLKFVAAAPFYIYWNWALFRTNRKHGFPAWTRTILSNLHGRFSVFGKKIAKKVSYKKYNPGRNGPPDKTFTRDGISGKKSIYEKSLPPGDLCKRGARKWARYHRTLSQLKWGRASECQNGVDLITDLRTAGCSKMRVGGLVRNPMHTQKVHICIYRCVGRAASISLMGGLTYGSMHV